MIEQRQQRGRNFFDRIIHFIYYYLDLYGEDGRPSHTKVLSTWGFFLALGMEIWWVVYLSYRSVDMAQIQDVITWPFVFLVVVTLALAMGRDTFKAALRMRNGGNGGKVRRSRRSPSYDEPNPEEA